MRSYLSILLTFFAALFLALLPMPEWAVWGRPAWVLLVLIFWTLAVPTRVNVGMAWVMGLLIDILNGSMLGEHALAMTMVIYLVYQSRMRVNMYPLLQQGLSVFIFVIFYQFILYCIEGFMGAAPLSRWYWLSSLTSMLLWPWFYVLMHDYRKWVRIELTD